MASVALIEMLVERLGNLEDTLQMMSTKLDSEHQFDKLKPLGAVNMYEGQLKEQVITLVRSRSANVDCPDWCHCKITHGMAETLKSNGFKVYGQKIGKSDNLWNAVVCWGAEPIYVLDVLMHCTEM